MVLIQHTCALFILPRLSPFLLNLIPRSSLSAHVLKHSTRRCSVRWQRILIRLSSDNEEYSLFHFDLGFIPALHCCPHSRLTQSSIMSCGTGSYRMKGISNWSCHTISEGDIAVHTCYRLTSKLNASAAAASPRTQFWGMSHHSLLFIIGVEGSSTQLRVQLI
jgi:hypothetical protein